MKFLIAGGLGFIGSHLVDSLVKKDHKIKILTKTLSKKKNIKNYLSINKWKEKGIANIDNLKIKTNVKAALILPDGTENSPAYLIFDNYEKILKWNRSLRFGITVCTLANMIKDEI